MSGITFKIDPESTSVAKAIQAAVKATEEADRAVEIVIGKVDKYNYDFENETAEWDSQATPITLDFGEEDIIAVEKVDNAKNGFVFNLTAKIEGMAHPYVAWPYACTFYDSARDKFCQIYTIGLDHTGPSKFVQIRTMSDSGIYRTWGEPTTIVDEREENLGATAHAANVMPNGSYLVGVRLSPNLSTDATGYLLCRSEDGGESWISEQWKDDQDADIIPAEAGSFFLTKAGSVLSYYRAKNGTNAILKSTDPNGANGTWSYKTLSIPMNGTPLEGSFIQLDSGRIMCVVRRNIGSGTITNPNTPLYTYSDDDGETWAPMAFTDILDCFDNPVALYKLPHRSEIICIYCSRRDFGNGLGSIYYSVTNDANIQDGIMGIPKRIGNGNANNDFGYASIAISKKGEILFSYYNGDKPKTSIYTYISYMRGQNGASLRPSTRYLHEYNRLFIPSYSSVTGEFGAMTINSLSYGQIIQRYGFIYLNIRISTDSLNIGTADGILELDISKYLLGIKPATDTALSATLVRGWDSSKTYAVFQPYLQPDGIIRISTNVDINATTTEFLTVSDMRAGVNMQANRIFISGVYALE